MSTPALRANRAHRGPGGLRSGLGTRGAGIHDLLPCGRRLKSISATVSALANAPGLTGGQYINWSGLPSEAGYCIECPLFALVERRYGVYDLYIMDHCGAAIIFMAVVRALARV